MRRGANLTGRHVRSIGKPAGFEVMEQGMRENFNRVKLKCEALLAQRVDELRQAVEGQVNALHGMDRTKLFRYASIERQDVSCKASRCFGAR